MHCTRAGSRIHALPEQRSNWWSLGNMQLVCFNLFFFVLLHTPSHVFVSDLADLNECPMDISNCSSRAILQTELEHLNVNVKLNIPEMVLNAAVRYFVYYDLAMKPFCTLFLTTYICLSTPICLLSSHTNRRITWLSYRFKKHFRVLYYDIRHFSLGKKQLS